MKNHRKYGGFMGFYDGFLGFLGDLPSGKRGHNYGKIQRFD